MYDMPRWIALLSIAGAVLAGCGSDSAPRSEDSPATVEEARDPGDIAVDTGTPDPMMTALGDAFRETNPGIASVTLLEFRRVSVGGGANFVVARGVRPRGTPNDDELFGVFMFDDSLQRIQQTLDVGWEILKLIPKSELRRINKDLLSRYFSELMEDGVHTPFV